MTVHIYSQKSWLKDPITTSNWPAATPGYNINIKHLKIQCVSQDVSLQTALEIIRLALYVPQHFTNRSSSETLCLKTP
jgi:hypothetical protein